MGKFSHVKAYTQQYILTVTARLVNIAILFVLLYYWQYFLKYHLDRLDIGNTFSEKYCKRYFQYLCP